MPMATDATVRLLDPVEIDAAAAMLTRAFWSSPLTELLAPDLSRRDEISRWLFGGAVRDGLRYGEVWAAVSANGAIQGAAIWHRPGDHRPGDEPVPTEDATPGANIGDAETILGPAGWPHFQELVTLLGQLHH